jgi:hypothetical protein
MLPDQSNGIFVTDGDSRRPLKALIRIQEIKATVTALINTKALHRDCPLFDVDPIV